MNSISGREKLLNYGFLSYKDTKELMINMKGTKIVIKLILYKKTFYEKNMFLVQRSATL